MKRTKLRFAAPLAALGLVLAACAGDADEPAASPEPDAEEWAIHDHEGFEGIGPAEYASFETVCDLADFIAEHGQLGARLYRNCGDDLEQARAAFEDYAGEYRSAADFAEELHRDLGTSVPECLSDYIDWQALAAACPCRSPAAADAASATTDQDKAFVARVRVELDAAWTAMEGEVERLRRRLAVVGVGGFGLV